MTPPVTDALPNAAQEPATTSTVSRTDAAWLTATHVLSNARSGPACVEHPPSTYCRSQPAQLTPLTGPQVQGLELHPRESAYAVHMANFVGKPEAQLTSPERHTHALVSNPSGGRGTHFIPGAQPPPVVTGSQKSLAVNHVGAPNDPDAPGWQLPAPVVEANPMALSAKGTGVNAVHAVEFTSCAELAQP